MTCLHGAFNLAVKRGYLAVNPMAGMKRIKTDTTPPRILSNTETASIPRTANRVYGFRWWALVYVALNTGARRGELLALPWSHVHFDKGRIHFAHTKGKRDRYVPINAPVVSILRRLQIQTLKYGGPFIGMEGKIQRRWDRIVREAEVSECTVHDLRRTYATRLIKAGVPLPTVQRLGGWSATETLMNHYTWISDADLREAVSRLGTGL